VECLKLVYCLILFRGFSLRYPYLPLGVAEKLLCLKALESKSYSHWTGFDIRARVRPWSVGFFIASLNDLRRIVQ
jgi:hypothetical protein